MKSISILALLVIVIIVLVALTKKRAPSASPELISDFNSGSVIVVDVREPNELQSGMIKGAINLPLSVIEAGGTKFNQAIGALSKDKQILLYCRSGRRSGIAASKLNSLGFQTKNLGGFSDAAAMGLPVK
jgi:rhodanese-related sulfurtransferase